MERCVGREGTVVCRSVLGNGRRRKGRRRSERNGVDVSGAGGSYDRDVGSVVEDK